jgi:hypothetical protein
MFPVLGSAKQASDTGPAGDGRDPREPDHGLGAHGVAPPAVDRSLERESTSGVEWLPRHAPHRRI